MATEIEKLVVKLTGDGSSYRRMLQQAERQTRSAMQNVRRLATQMTVGVTLPLAAIGVASVKAFADFDLAMTRSTSIMSTTAAQTERMRQAALSLSGVTTHAPEQLAEAYYFLASAGLDAEQSIAALPQVARFATAGAFDLALATDLLTDAQSALGLTVRGNAEQNARNMEHVSDVLSRASVLANASIQQFSESITNDAGAALRSFGVDMETGVAVLAAFADQGNKGLKAGSDLARIMRLMSAASRDSAEEHRRLGFSVFNADGSMRNFADIVGNLEQILGPMSAELRAATLEQLGFDARVQGAILPLIGTSEAIRRYERELRQAGGTTQEVADRQMKAFSNQLKILWNNIKIAAIGIGENLAPAIQYISNAIKQGISYWNALPKWVKTTAAVVGTLIAALGPLLAMIGLIGPGVAAGAGILGGLFTTVLSAASALLPIIALLGLAIGGFIAYMGGVEEAWTAIQETAVSAWNAIQSAFNRWYEWAKPILIEFGYLFQTIWDRTVDTVQTAIDWIGARLNEFINWASGMFSWLTGDTELNWETIRDGIVDALIFAEYYLNNFSGFWKLIWLKVKLTFLEFTGTIDHFFRVAIPAILTWFGNNWRDVFKTAASYGYNAMSNMSTNIVTVIRRLPELISGAVSLDEIWTPLQEGATNFIRSLPEIPDRIQSEFEQKTRRQFEAQRNNLSQGWEEFYAERMADIERNMNAGGDFLGVNSLFGSVPPGTGTPAGEEIGQNIANAIGSEVKTEMDRMDAVLLRSAEGVARVMGYQQRLRESFESVNRTNSRSVQGVSNTIGGISGNRPSGAVGGGSPAAGGVRQATGGTRSLNEQGRQITLLTQILAGINSLNNKPLLNSTIGVGGV